MNSETLKNKLKPIVYPIINFIPRRRLKNKNFTIICDNCWAGKVYQELGLPYQTPFVGMFVFSPDYIKMLKNLKHYLSGNIPLTFVKESKYIKDFDNAYPLALLDDIELHFNETYRPSGPYGAAGCGEAPLDAPHPAILNAIYNATGARITRVPARPERVLAALKELEK